MDDITEATCSIDYAAVHMLDNRHNRLALADVPLDLDPNRVEFLRRHIVKSIGRSAIGMFNDRDSNNVSVSCEKIFTKPREIAIHSQDLATRLFELMKPKTIKPGTLWSVLFGDQDSPTRYLALLKMDDVDTYRYRPVTKRGKRSIHLHKSFHILPNPRMKLDKAAFVVPEEVTELKYEVRVLDNILPEEKVAGYFTDFLAFHAPQTNREKTRLFNSEVERWIQQAHLDLPPTINEQELRDFKRVYLNSNTRVSLKRFAGAALGSDHPDLQKSLIKHLRGAGLKDSQFDVEQSEWSKLSSKLVYRLKLGDRVVDIKGEFDDVKAMVTITQPTEDHAQYHVAITADSLQEI